MEAGHLTLFVENSRARDAGQGVETLRKNPFSWCRTSKGRQAINYKKLLMLANGGYRTIKLGKDEA